MSELVDVSVVLRCGVYLLLHRGTVVYVGKSKLMLGRVYNHRVAWGRSSRKRITQAIPARGILFDQVLMHPCRLDEIDEIEASYIEQYAPRYNTQLKTCVPPELSALVARLVPAQSVAAPIVDRRGM